MKKVKGYTLVELVVVIAIIGTLSAALIPNMVGWVGKSRYRSAMEQAESIFNSAQTIAQKYESIDMAVKYDQTDTRLFSGEHTYGNLPGVVFKDKAEESATDADKFYEKLFAMNTHLNNNSCRWAVVIRNYKVVHVFWAPDDTNNYVGIYCAEPGCTRGGHNADFETYRSRPMKNIRERWNELT